MAFRVSNIIIINGRPLWPSLIVLMLSYSFMSKAAIRKRRQSHANQAAAYSASDGIMLELVLLLLILTMILLLYIVN